MFSGEEVQRSGVNVIPLCSSSLKLSQNKTSWTASIKLMLHFLVMPRTVFTFHFLRDLWALYPGMLKLHLAGKTCQVQTIYLIGPSICCEENEVL